jgi:predicted membrane protein
METEAQLNSKEQSADRLATASFVMGIISIVSVLCCCPFVFSAIGIVLALLSKGASDALRPRAKTGLILSIAGLVISFVLTIFTIVFPIVMYKTNPEFRKNINNAMEESLQQDEELFRQIYGDDVYEQMQQIIKEDSL